MTRSQQVVDVSDPPVREAGTVQADVDELVGLATIGLKGFYAECIWIIKSIQEVDFKMCHPGGQAEGEGLLH